MASALPKHPPEEFERMFLQLGRLACQDHFKASRRMIDAWLREIGKTNLIEARGGTVAGLRRKPRRLSSGVRRMVIVEDSRPANPRIAAAAAQFLRIVRNGGWIVSRTQFGDWRVGMKRLSAHQLIEMAIAKGFDPEGVRE
jgi:hypothetical protein